MFAMLNFMTEFFGHVQKFRSYSFGQVNIPPFPFILMNMQKLIFYCSHRVTLMPKIN